MTVNRLPPKGITKPVPAGEPYRPKYIVTAEGRISYPLNENGEPDLEKMREIKHALRHFRLKPVPDRENWGRSYYQIEGEMSTYKRAEEVNDILTKAINRLWPANDLKLDLIDKPHPDNIVK